MAIKPVRTNVSIFGQTAMTSSISAAQALDWGSISGAFFGGCAGWSIGPHEAVVSLLAEARLQKEAEQFDSDVVPRKEAVSIRAPRVGRDGRALPRPANLNPEISIAAALREPSRSETRSGFLCASSAWATLSYRFIDT